MAHGDFGYKDKVLYQRFDHNDDDDDEQEVNRTRPFQPGEPVEASTPYHDGETIEMQTWQPEQNGLPDTSYEETPLLGDLLSQEEKDSNVEDAKDFIKKKFPDVDFRKLRPISYGNKEGNKSFIVSFGPKGGETKIFKIHPKTGEIKDLQQKYKTIIQQLWGQKLNTSLLKTASPSEEENQRLID